MDKLVKKFIEDNIDLIKDANWQELYAVWGLHYEGDSEQLNEFFTAMKTIGLELKDSTREIRKNIIIQDMREIIQDAKDNEDSSITIVTVVKHLTSKFDFYLTELLELFKETATSMGLKPTNDGRVRYKL